MFLKLLLNQVLSLQQCVGRWYVSTYMPGPTFPIVQRFILLHMSHFLPDVILTLGCLLQELSVVSMDTLTSLTDQILPNMLHLLTGAIIMR